MRCFARWGSWLLWPVAVLISAVVVSLFALSFWGSAGDTHFCLLDWLGWLPVSGHAQVHCGIEWPYLVLPSIAMGAIAGCDSHADGADVRCGRIGPGLYTHARAKGLTEFAVVCRHALPMAGAHCYRCRAAVWGAACGSDRDGNYL